MAFSLGFSVRVQTGKALIHAYPNPITTAFKALTVGAKGLWWWRQIDVVAAGISGDLPAVQSAMREAKLTENDYYLVF